MVEIKKFFQWIKVARRVVIFLARSVALLLLWCYRCCVSPVLGNNCRFYPSCSEYAVTAIKLHGVGWGCWLAMKRLLRCHPWCVGGYDPVPAFKKELHSRGDG